MKKKKRTSTKQQFRPIDEVFSPQLKARLLSGKLNNRCYIEYSNKLGALDVSDPEVVAFIHKVDNRFLAQLSIHSSNYYLGLRNAAKKNLGE